MKLKALDQLHVSAVKPDSLRPGEEFEVSDELGSELLTKHPAKFLRLDAQAKPRAPRKMTGTKPKAAKPRSNKMQPQASNKADG
jgi:hypothetical protein